jgi:hypothetical protein
MCATVVFFCFLMRKVRKRRKNAKKVFRIFRPFRIFRIEKNATFLPPVPLPPVF